MIYVSFYPYKITLSWHLLWLFSSVFFFFFLILLCLILIAVWFHFHYFIDSHSYLTVRFVKWQCCIWNIIQTITNDSIRIDWNCTRHCRVGLKFAHSGDSKDAFGWHQINIKCNCRRWSATLQCAKKTSSNETLELDSCTALQTPKQNLCYKLYISNRAVMIWYFWFVTVPNEHIRLLYNQKLLIWSHNNL